MLLESFTLYLIEKRLIMTSSIIESSLVGLVLLAVARPDGELRAFGLRCFKVHLTETS